VLLVPLGVGHRAPPRLATEVGRSGQPARAAGRFTPPLYGVEARTARLAVTDGRRPVAQRLLTTGMAGYTKTGIVGRPSLATAEKGTAILTALSAAFRSHLAQLQ
jgi:hypothetical protein